MKLSDEAAVLLRIGAFGLAAGVGYGLLAYEWLGTLALLTLGLGPLTAGLVLAVHPPAGAGRERAVLLVRRLAGFPPQDPAGGAEDLEADDLMIIPSPSVWPFMLSLGFAVALTGLVFGLWLLLLGGLLSVWALSGWIAAVNRETRLGRLRPTPPARPDEPTADAPAAADRAGGDEHADRADRGDRRGPGTRGD